MIELNQHVETASSYPAAGRDSVETASSYPATGRDSVRNKTETASSYQATGRDSVETASSYPATGRDSVEIASSYRPATERDSVRRKNQSTLLVFGEFSELNDDQQRSQYCTYSSSAVQSWNGLIIRSNFGNNGCQH